MREAIVATASIARTVKVRECEESILRDEIAFRSVHGQDAGARGRVRST